MSETIKAHPGWHGSFTRNQAPGAYPNGTRIVKVETEHGDTNPVGAMGTVLGSLQHPRYPEMGIGYFIEWDRTPRCAVLVVAWKIRLHSPPT